MKRLLMFFLVFLLAAEASGLGNNDFELGLRSYKDGIYGLSLKYLMKYLDQDGEADLEKKIIAQFHIAKIYLQTGKIREATQVIDTILKRRKILVENGLYDSARLMKGQCISYLSGIKEAFSYVDIQKLSSKDASIWDIRLSITRFLSAVKGDSVIDEVLDLYRNEIDKKTQALLYLMKVEQLLNSRSAFEALSLLTEKIEKEFDIIKSHPSMYSHYLHLSGDAYYQTQDYAMAVSFYQKALEAADAGGTSRGPLTYKMGLALWKKKDYKSSLNYLKEFHQDHKGDRQAGEAINVLAQVYIAMGEYETAREFLIPFLDSEIKNEDYYKTLYWLAESYFHQGQLDQASIYYDKMTDSTDEEILNLAKYGKGWACYKNGHVEQAEKDLEELLEKNLTKEMKENVQLILANIYFLRAGYDECIRILSELIEVSGEDEKSKLYYKMGLCHFLKKDYEGSVSIFNKILNEKTQSFLKVRALYKIAQSCYKSGEYDQSITYYKQIIDTYPKSDLLFSAYLEIGHAYYNLFRYEDAISTYRLIIEKAKEDYYKTRAKYFMGWCYYLTGKESETVKIFRSYLKEFPDAALSPDTQFWLGEYFYNKKYYEESLKEYRALVEHYPDCYLVDDALFWGAKASQKKNDDAMSLEMLDMLINKYPKSDLIPDALIEKSDIFFARKELKKALSSIETAIENYPDSYLYYDALIKKAFLFKEMEELGKAVEIFEDVFEKYKKNNKSLQPDWMLEAAFLYNKTGQNEKAMEKLMTLIYGDYGQETFKASLILAKDILVEEKRYEDALILMGKLLQEGKEINTISIRRDIRKLRSKLKEREG